MSERDASFFQEIQIEFLIHELKNPMAIIETSLRGLLQRENKFGILTDAQKRALNRALRNSKKVREMLSGLLEVGKSEAECFSCRFFQPAEAVKKCLFEVLETIKAPDIDFISIMGNHGEESQILADHNVFMEISQQATTVQMMQDETKFCQIVSNLVNNALKYRKKRLNIRLSIQHELLCLEVEDDGTGIASKHHEFIFQRYTQINGSADLSRDGHGLGLAASRILARCLGGDIELMSQKGQGAVFRLTLPIIFHQSAE